MIKNSPVLPKIAVVIPPIEDFYFTYHRFSILGAKIVQTISKTFDPNSLLFNFPLLKKKPSNIDLPIELSYLKNFIMDNEHGKLTFFTKYKRFGPSIDDCTKIILSSDINICLISCFAYCYGHTAVQLAENLKKCDEHITVIIGGAGVSANPSYFLNSHGIDYTISGEAEIALPLLLSYLNDKDVSLHLIPNIGWKENGYLHFSKNTLFTQSSDIKPFVTVTHKDKNKTYLSTTLSRGCTFKCQFCSNRISQGQNFRTIDISSFTEALTHCLESEQTEIINAHINIEDDNILLDYNYLKRILILCKEHIPNATFSFENGIDYRLLDNQKCQELIDLGVTQFNFSIATTASHILYKEKRMNDFHRLIELYKVLKKNDILSITYFICGFPDDTCDTIIDTLLFLLQNDTLSGISLFYSVPGLLSNNHSTIQNLSHPCLFAGSSAFPWNASLSTKTLVTAFRISRFINLLKQKNKSVQETFLIEQSFKAKRLFTLCKLAISESEIQEVPNQDYNLVQHFFDRLAKIDLQ